MDFSLIEDNKISLAGDGEKSYTFTFRSDIKKSDKLPVLMPTKDYLPLLKHNFEILKTLDLTHDNEFSQI